MIAIATATTAAHDNAVARATKVGGTAPRAGPFRPGQPSRLGEEGEF
eukprot:CAMPEP_0183740370 /NCGR_PEP_ID=MMETSP0737-20130205/59470_1 /TAXON_ID=385413 /ORGANISM="Thalassiosira miniscula, Strain CCMP1093" /LENGTH=46 /DNA_ID= /DNA_START= /DNA_END= /DNA_ORIENTATION=